MKSTRQGVGEVFRSAPSTLRFFILALFFYNRYYYLNYFINRSNILIKQELPFLIPEPL